MGIARAVGAILFSVIIGLLMHFLPQGRGGRAAGHADGADRGGRETPPMAERPLFRLHGRHPYWSSPTGARREPIPDCGPRFSMPSGY